MREKERGHVSGVIVYQYSARLLLVYCIALHPKQHEWKVWYLGCARADSKLGQGAVVDSRAALNTD